MPVVTVTSRAPKTAEFKAQVFDAIQAALVAIGAHPNDRFHRFIELNEADFQFDPTFPDVRTRRSADFLLVEILLGVGRSVKLKKQVLDGIVERLSVHGFDCENLMVIFHDVPWENFSPAGGRVPHA